MDEQAHFRIDEHQRQLEALQKDIELDRQIVAGIKELLEVVHKLVASNEALARALMMPTERQSTIDLPSGTVRVLSRERRQ